LSSFCTADVKTLPADIDSAVKRVIAELSK